MTIYQGVVVVTSQRTKPALIQAMGSLLDCLYPVLIHSNHPKKNQFEIGGLKLGMENFDEFLLLHDTCTVKDTKLFDIVFNEYLGRSVSIDRNYRMFLGKYRSKVLRQMVIPTVSTKNAAIAAEQTFGLAYCEIEKPLVLFEGYQNDFSLIEENGLVKRIYENKYLRKIQTHYHGYLKEDY
jgi:hypothetical protein